MTKSGEFTNKEWGCILKDIIVERGPVGRKFRLSIPYLRLTPGLLGSMKLPLMGVSGAGKSTLLNLLAAMTWPVNGKITWLFPNGDEVTWNHKGLPAGDAKKLRNHYFGFAFQDSTLIPHLNVLDNLCYPLLLKGVTYKAARDTAFETLNRVLLQTEDVSGLVKRFPSQLSGGQRQRVSLMQALIQDPYVLFADEPTGSLDRLTRDQVMRVLYNWVDKVGGERALFWVTHHENDPQDARLSLRLFVRSGLCGWQRFNENHWEPIENEGMY